MKNTSAYSNTSGPRQLALVVGLAAFTPAQSLAQSDDATLLRRQLEPQQTVFSNRDSVGDLNRETVSAGDLPGSFKIPGSGDVSLSIGGFIKAAAIADSDAENMGADNGGIRGYLEVDENICSYSLGRYRFAITASRSRALRMEIPWRSAHTQGA